jgi:hypothetical protein
MRVNFFFAVASFEAVWLQDNKNIPVFGGLRGQHWHILYKIKKLICAKACAGLSKVSEI